MKKSLLFLFLLVAGVSSAQIINFPDPVLKQQLLSASEEVHITAGINGGFFTLDANGDGEIQQSEADLVYTLVIGSNNMSSIEGIQHFSNVDYIVCNSVNSLSFDFTIIPSLKHLQYQGDLTNIIINGSQSIEHLDFDNNPNTTINLENLPALKELFFYNGEYTSLSFHDLPLLESIRLEENPLTSLELYNLPAIKTLMATENELTTVDFSGVPTLEYLDISYNPLTVIDLTVLPNIKSAGLSYSPLQEADFSNSPNIRQVALNHCPQLTWVNLKNGNTVPSSLYMFGGTTSVDYICADESDMSLLAGSLGIVDSNVQINTYCTFTPGGRYNTINGNITYDSASDGCDATDAVLNTFVQVNLSSEGQQATYYTNTGSYNFYTGIGTFQLSPQVNNEWFTINPSVGEVTFDNVEYLTAVQDFCISANGVHPDTDVIVVPLGAAQPGFDAAYKIIYKNKGNQTLNGDVTFTYDDSILDYVLASPVETSSFTGSLSWSYSNLLPFETREIVVTLNVNSPMETPAVNINDVQLFTATVTPVSGDETPADNTFEFNQTVVGSLDPNEIICLDGTTVSPDKIGEYLHYNVNFENTGTAPATFVVVKDIIDATKYDISTLQILNASHAMEARITNNKAEFIFDNINLAANGGKGNVTFKIKTLENLTLNSSVTQQADIYFDYNWPIVTNEATTTFEVLSTGNFTKDTSVKLYPNPAKNTVNITAQGNIQTVQLYDVQGRLLQAANASGLTTAVDVSGRAAGIYFVKVITDKGTAVEKLVKE